jgi:hypothetical protein
MLSQFTKNITPHVNEELLRANKAKTLGLIALEFQHLENAHVLGQESTYLHVKVHCLMLLWGIRNNDVKESVGQCLRVIGAATKTAFGLVPTGNTGGANVSPFKVLAIKPAHQKLIHGAKKSQ